MTGHVRDNDDGTETPRDNAEEPTRTDEEEVPTGDGDTFPAVGLRSLSGRTAAGVRARLPVATRSSIQRYATVILAIFVGTAVLGGAGLYSAGVGLDTEERTETVAEWSTSATFSHSAVIQHDTTVFSRGERLADRSMYFTRVSPTADGEYVVSHNGDIDDGVGTIDLWLVLRSSEQQTIGDERREVIHWERREELATVTDRPFESGDQQRVSFSVNASTVRERLSQIETELGASPGATEAVIVANASFSGIVGGERLSETRSDRLQVELDPNTFSIVSDIEQPTTQAVTEAVTVPADPSPVMTYTGASAFAVGLAGAVGFLWLRSAGAFALSAAERRRLSFERTREKHDRWICRGQPSDAEGRDVVELDTLADAVTVAMVNDRVVVERRWPRLEYAVFEEDVTYRFTPPALTAERSPRAEADEDSHVSPDSEQASDPADD